MKKLTTLILILLILSFGLAGCNQNPRVLKNIFDDKEIHRRYTIEILREFIGNEYDKSTDLSLILKCKTIDLHGIIRTVSFEKAISLNNNNIKKENPDVLPIFELENTSNVILTIYGNGYWGRIWAFLLMDLEKLKITNILIDHMKETGGLGDDIRFPAFKNQFIGKKIGLSGNNFALHQKGEKIIEGNHSIDGVSGATMTSIGVIEMLNMELLKYEEYFRQSLEI